MKEAVYRRGRTLRLVGSSFSGERVLCLTSGNHESGDQIVEEKGRTLVTIERSLSEAYDGCVLRRLDSNEGSIRLTVGPPEALECAR